MPALLNRQIHYIFTSPSAKLSMYMSGQALAFAFEFPNQGWVVFVYKLIEQSLFWAMAFVGCLAKGILA